MICMAFSISATLGFSGGSLASSGTSALQDRATGLAPSFPEWLKVFFEDCGNENEFVDSEKTFTEVSKTWHFQENLIKKSIVVEVPTSSTLPPNYSIRAKGSTSQSLYFEPWAEKPFLGARAAWKSWFSWFFRFSLKCSPRLVTNPELGNSPEE